MADSELFAFVLMPFNKAFDDFYKLGIKEPAATLGVLAERVDEQIFQEGVLERIYRQIEVADVVIADMTGQNPNVFYEVGYAHAKKKICIHLTQSAEDIPFDLKHHRHIVYGTSVSELRARVLDELAWAKQQIKTNDSSRIKITLKPPVGLLETTKWSAIGNCDFKFDLHNETDQPSEEIEAIYFYCRKGWTLRQDGRELLKSQSDLTDFGERHFISPPMRRLTRNGWAQVKFNAKRILAFAVEGEDLSDSYTVAGRVLIRIVTAKADFDYPFNIDVKFDDVPF